MGEKSAEEGRHHLRESDFLKRRMSCGKISQTKSCIRNPKT